VLQGFYVLPDVSGSTEWGVDPSVRFRVASRVQGSVGLHYSEVTNDQQWYNNFSTPGGTAYTFARLEQRTSSVTARLDYTMTPTLSFQLYAQPFITSGDYSDLRELADPRADRYEERVPPYTAASPYDFLFTPYRSNSVLSWEYRPGQAGWGTFDNMQNAIEHAIGDGPFVLGERFSMADIVLGGTVGYLLRFKMLDARPRFIDYVERLTARDASARAKAKNAEMIAAHGLGA